MNILDKFSLAGKHALVTYPEYTYGTEIAAGLAAAGAAVYLAGPDQEALDQAAADMQAAGVSAAGTFIYSQETEAAAAWSRAS